MVLLLQLASVQLKQANAIEHKMFCQSNHQKEIGEISNLPSKDAVETSAFVGTAAHRVRDVLTAALCSDTYGCMMRRA